MKILFNKGVFYCMVNTLLGWGTIESLFKVIELNLWYLPVWITCIILDGICLAKYADYLNKTVTL